MIPLFIAHLATVKEYKACSLQKMKLLLSKVEEAYGKPLYQAKKAREIEEAVIRASTTRSIKPNGHPGLNPNDSRYYRYRLALAVSCYFRWAESEREIEKSPYPEVTFRKPARKEPDWLTDDQVRRIKNCPGLTVREQVMFRVMLDTGVRRSEYLSLRFKDCSLSERLVHVACGAKTEKARTVPFTEETKTWLEIWRPIAGGEYLTGERIGTNALGERFGILSRAVGFRVHAHQVRHTTARIWVESTKAHPFDIAALLGHETMDMTKWYYHTEGGHLRMIQDSLNKPLVTESVTHNN